ncbi:unnamed protein product [Cunninghamella blakesleeana]
MATLEQVIFLGTGCSSCSPNVTCLTNPKQDCKACISSMTPEGRKNRRNNVSIAIRFRCHDDPSDFRLRTVIIDCGKTFYESSINLFPKYGIRQIDGVILTHGHLDSMAGLDDLRSLTLGSGVQDKVDIYLMKETMDSVKDTYPFLVNSALATGGGDVATFKYHILDPLSKFNIYGLTFEPLPVHHGIYFTTKEPYLFYGFQFQGVTYISDTNFIPKETMDKIKKEKSQILVLDCLKYGSIHPSHFGLDDALIASREINATKTLLVGFSHRMDHYELEEHLLMEKDIKIAPAFDGLKLDFTSKDKIIESSYFTDENVLYI